MEEHRRLQEEAAHLEQSLQYLKAYRQTCEELRRELNEENTRLLQSMKQLDPDLRQA